MVTRRRRGRGRKTKGEGKDKAAKDGAENEEGDVQREI
jgi:hypothetical protein